MPSIGELMIVCARFTSCWFRFAWAWPSEASDDFSDASADFTVTSAVSRSAWVESFFANSSLTRSQLHLRVLEADPVALEVGLALHERRLRLLDLGVDRVGVDPQEDLALLDDRVEVDRDLLDDAAHLRADRDRGHRVERAGGADDFGDVAAADTGAVETFGSGPGRV